MALHSIYNDDYDTMLVYMLGAALMIALTMTATIHTRPNLHYYHHHGYHDILGTCVVTVDAATIMCMHLLCHQCHHDCMVFCGCVVIVNAIIAHGS